ncbi:putative integral membrane sensor protein [Parafrankia sp. EAN1pec]|uniref:MHYT domain-containing protein n=1 Tax=Parafrankia sp. (strain EAN1pec) TaxID=298653 RepID=UPI0000543068|nr:putative integral membrane sensor protein [Frankia sp. EAN1pec]
MGNNMSFAAPLQNVTVEYLAADHADHAHLHASYNLYFVALSYGLAALGSFAALASASRIREHVGFRRLGWSAVTALALGGGGIWSMHFVGMVAYHIGTMVTFDMKVTTLSLLIAVAVSGVGIWVVASDPFNAGRLIGGGTFAGLGIAAMHYTGMAAMRTSGTISYRPGLVLLSIAIAVVAAVAAFGIAFRVGGTGRVLGASFVMAAAVCGMHYTAMAATRVTPDPTLSRPTGFDPFALGIVSAFGSVIVMMFIIVHALGGVSDPEFNVRKIMSDRLPEGSGPDATPGVQTGTTGVPHWWSSRHTERGQAVADDARSGREVVDPQAAWVRGR